MAMKRFQRGSQVAPGAAAVDPTAGAPEDTLVNIFTRFAVNQAQRVQAEGNEAAALEGFNAGVEGEELPTASNITPAGQAFNRAARIGHLAAVRTDIKSRLGELAIGAEGLAPEDRVDTYVAQSEGYRDGLLEEVPPSLRGEVLTYFNDTASVHRLKLLGGQQRDLFKQTQNELKVGQAQLLDDINTAAREGNFELLTVRQREYEAMMQAGAEAGAIDPTIADAAIKDMHSIAVQGEVLGSFEAVLEGQGLEAAAESLDRFKRQKATGLDLSVEEKDQLETTMTALFNRERSFQAATEARETAADQAATARLRSDTRDAIRMLESGYSTEVETLARSLTDANEQNLLIDLAEAVELQGQVSLFQAAPLAAQDQVLADMREQLDAGTVDPQQFKAYQALEKSRNQSAALLNKDPRELAVRQSVIPADDNEPLSFESVQDLSASLAARLPATAAASNHYGREIPVLNAAETDALGAFWTSQGIPEKLALTESIMTGLGPQGGALLQSLDKRGYKQAAFVGGLMAEDQEHTAAAVLRGQEAIAASDELLPQGTEGAMLDDDIAAILGRSFEDLPQRRQITVDAIKAHYADRAASEGDFTGRFNANRLEASVEAVVGNIVEDRTGAAVPVRDIDQGEFDRWLDTLADTDINQAGGLAGHTPEQALATIGRSRIIAVGPGVFRFKAPTLSGGFADLVTETGQPFELQIDTADLPPPATREQPTMQAL